MGGGVFREVTIHFGGKDYAFVPSNKLLRRIESEGVSIIGIAQAAAQGKPLISHLALFTARCLGDAGVPVTEDDIYGEMVGPNAMAMIDTANALLAAIFPETAPEKPVPAPASKAPAKPKRKA